MSDLPNPRSVGIISAWSLCLLIPKMLHPIESKGYLTMVYGSGSQLEAC
jgi:hypothetical protein